MSLPRRRSCNHCHCSRCRRLHGTLYATYAYVQREHLAVEAGTDSLSTYHSELVKWQFLPCLWLPFVR